MGSLKREAWIKPDHQDLLIQGLRQFNDRIIDFSQQCLEATHLRMSVERMAQFVATLLLALTFGIAPGTAFSILQVPAFHETREYIASMWDSFPAESTVTREVGWVTYMCRKFPPLGAALENLAKPFTDSFYAAVGSAARATFQAVLETTRAKVTPPAECFVGVENASELFPSLGAEALERLAPFFNVWVWNHARRGTSTSELIGELKKPCFEGGRMHFKDAGELGFVNGCPDSSRFYAAFQFIEANIDPAWNAANLELTCLGAHDLTATTADGTNVPVDKRDTTGSVGTGSRGTFSGQKALVGAGANCLPVAGVVGGGRVSDISLLEDTLAPMEDLARLSGQDTWVDILDAGYSSPSVFDRIEAGGAVAFVDLNPRNSTLLQDQKVAVNALKDLSKKAVKEGLTAEERKAWLDDARGVSEARGDRVPVSEKKSKLKKFLRKLAGRARRHGLTPAERKQERSLRKAVMATRHEIRTHGTPEEKRVGLQPVALGTIEWYLVYFIRGQNEGINGILKKRGDLIGDGQDTSWIIGQASINGRARGDLAGICIVALVNAQVSGKIVHLMCTIYKWSRRSKSFWVLWFVSFCR